jgi:hypothetical protein
MKRLAFLVLCALAFTTLAGCAAYYNRIMYPEAKFDPGDQ